MMKKTHFTNRIIWICAGFLLWCVLFDSILAFGAYKLISGLRERVSNELYFVLENYSIVIVSCLLFLFFCAVFKKNRFLLEVIRPTKEKRSMSHFGAGILLGFLTNFFCVICALLHGDIKLTFDFSASQIPLLVFAFVSVLIQSASEEMWSRGYLMERINVHYPLWVGILVNSVFFGALHIFNDGISALAMADIIICGIAYSLLYWYSGSIWTSFGIHTMWNFTQNFLFGLPNSGLVSECSLFHLDAASGISNWVYSYEFGVEGGVPAVFIDLLLAVVILWLAKRDGRLGELMLSKEMTGEVPVLPQDPHEEERHIVEFPYDGPVE